MARLFDDSFDNDSTAPAAWFDKDYAAATALAFPIVGATQFWKEGDYSEDAYAGIWRSANNGLDLTTASYAPKANRRAPLFFAGASKSNGGVPMQPLADGTGAATLISLIGAGDCHVITVIDVDRMTTNAGFPHNGAPFGTGGGNLGIEVYLDSPTPTAKFYYASGSIGDSSTFDGWKVVTVDVSAYVDARGRGRLVLQGKKQGGFVWIRVGTDAWVQGDACADMWDSAQAATLVVGQGYDTFLDGTVRALGFYTAVQSDVGWSNDLLAWATATFAIDSPRTGIWNIGQYSQGHRRWPSLQSDLAPLYAAAMARELDGAGGFTTPAGVTINSLTGPAPDGVDDYLDATAISSDFFKENGEEFTIGVAINPKTPSGANLGTTLAQQPYSNPGLACDSVGYWTLAWADDGGTPKAIAGVYDGQTRDPVGGGTVDVGNGLNDGWQMALVPVPANTPAYIQMRLRGHVDTQLLDLRVNTGSWTSVSCGACVSLAAILRFFSNYSLGYFVKGDVGQVAIDRVALSDADCNARGLEAQTLTGWSFGFTAPAQNITSAGDIATAAAFGTAQINENVTSAGNIATANAVSSPTVTTGPVTVSPSSIAGAEAFGTAQLNENVTAPTSIVSAESVSTPAVTVGAVTVSPSSIAGAEAFGTAQLNLNIPTAGNVASAESVASPTITTGAVTVSGAGDIATAQSIPSPQLNLNTTPSSVASSEAFGSPTITTGPVTVSTAGNVASAETVGAPSLTENITGVGDVAGAETFGLPTLTTGAVTVAPSSVVSAEAVPSPQLNLNVAAAGDVASLAAVSSPAVTVGAVTVSPSSVASGETVDNPALGAFLVPDPIASAEAFGGPTITTGPVTVSGAGDVASGAAFGAPQVNESVAGVGDVATGETLGSPALSFGLTAGSVASSEAFGTATLASNITAGNVASAESVSTPAIVPGAVGVSGAGDVSGAEAFGLANLSGGLVDVGDIEGDEAFGDLTLSVFVSGSGGITSAEAFGSPAVVPGAATISPSSVTSSETIDPPMVVGQGAVVGAGDVASAENVPDPATFFGRMMVPSGVDPAGGATTGPVDAEAELP